MCAPVAWQLALFRHPNGTFFLLGSHQNGWAPNPLVLLRAQGTDPTTGLVHGKRIDPATGKVVG